MDFSAISSIVNAKSFMPPFEFHYANDGTTKTDNTNPLIDSRWALASAAVADGIAGNLRATDFNNGRRSDSVDISILLT